MGDGLPALEVCIFLNRDHDTLGFGDIHAAPGSSLGHVLLTGQVLMGYLLLGALISRLAVLFQSGGPTEISEPDSIDVLEEWNIEQEVGMWRLWDL